MLSFEKDRAERLAQYLRQAPCAPLEELRDTLYQAYLRLKTQDPAQVRLGNTLLEQAAWGPCPYSGLPAVQLLTECADALSEEARAGLLDFLRAGRPGWLAELERNKCNSFRLLAAVSLLGCGLLLDDRDAGAAGRAALVWMEDHLAAVDLPDEFLSPFYTALQLAALAEIRLLPVGADCAGRAGRLEAFFWRGVLRHYQPGLTELAGPYSRGYTSELAGHFQIIMACIYRLLGHEAGFTFRDTLWDPAYSAAILPHGSLENMRYYALYFSGFPYRCDPEDLEALRRRTYPCVTVQRTRTDPSRDVSIKRTVADGTPWDYPAGEVRVTLEMEDGFALGWTDREFENGMACPGVQALYRRDGAVKSFFPKLVREDRYIGEWNDYPNLGLRLNPSNFPDDGRKTVVREGDGLHLTYRPRGFCRGASAMKLDLIFASQFSPPEEIRIGSRTVERWDGLERFPLEQVTVWDGAWEFMFRPLRRRGYWKIARRNGFLNVEWVQTAEDFDSLTWELLLQVRRRTRDESE